MISLLKTFGKGILYVIGMPFFILALVLFAVIGIFLFLFQIIRSVIYFFTGQKFFPELEEDKQLRLLKEKAAGLNSEEEEQVEEMPSSMNEDSIIIPLPPVIQKQPEPVEEQHSPIEEACFVESEELMEEKEEDNEDEDILMQSLVREQLAQEEAKIEEPIEEPFVEMKEETLETSEPKEEEPFVEEELEEYVPKSSSYFEEYEDEEDTNDNGVDIDYDVR